MQHNINHIQGEIKKNNFNTIKTIFLLSITFISQFCFAQVLKNDNCSYNLQVKNNTIDFTSEINQPFYSYIVEELDILNIKRGYYNEETIYFSCYYTSKGELDSIKFAPLGSQFRKMEIQTIFEEIGNINFVNYNNGDAYLQIIFRLYIWEEMGEVSLIGYIK